MRATDGDRDPVRPVAVRDYRCHVCGARRGEECVTKAGAMTRPHWRRWCNAAAAMIRRDLEAAA